MPFLLPFLLSPLLTAYLPQPEAPLVFHLTSGPLVPTAPGGPGWALALNLLIQDPQSPECVPNPFSQSPHGCQTKPLKRPSLSHSPFQTHLRLPSAWGKDCRP